MSIPIGVIGVIYESRPNVTSDVASLCFKSGNVVILKGGSEAINSNKALAKLFRKALKKNKVDENFIQFIDSKQRRLVDIMLSKMKKYIDVIIPRGGKNLVKKVLKLSKVPIIGHLEGLCHTYIDKDAELKMAKEIVYNAKLRNTSICGATETILIHKDIVKKFSNPILQELENSGCKIIGDKILKSYYNGQVYPAKEKDWSTEYLSSIVSVKVVKNSEEAIKHINKYGTMHTDSIITKNKKTAKYFLKNIPGILEVILQLRKRGWQISRDQIMSGLSRITRLTDLKGRFQILSSYPKVIADISHNIEGFTELIAQVRLLEPNQLHIIYGAAKGRNIDEIFLQFPKNALCYLVSGNNSRLMDLKSLAEIAENNNIEKYEFLNVNLALTFVKSIAHSDDIILITGSTFIIGVIEELLQDKKNGDLQKIN